ncbi:uncharacterized protein LOC110450317 isoform X2 [Mizuhopecten yessoensis]|uniref:uncharacterized protein LOC110450317 isoform X2 n=1 Tax=Mizuhopecten yessoensis TaxID=6573 RepID=UPI000B45C05F|nr:uncharacterized protein LOC110450317 isoform X2 [Mizuhopecten yessoensis]
MCSQVEILRLLSNADLGEVKSMNALFINLIKSNDNTITYRNYDEIYDIFNDQDVEAGHIIQRFTKRITEASKTKGKRKQRRNCDSESETEESNSKGRKGYHKHSRDSDSDSGREADGGESNQRKENAGNLRKEFDDMQNARIVYTWQTAMNAVGFIQGPVAQGTGFRVGKDKIMTAYKVVEDITKIHKGAKPDLSNLGQNNVFITFNFIEANDSKNTRKFYITECLFHDKEMDFAILQLRNKDKTEDSSYPKAITHFKPVYPDQTFALLSHHHGKPLQLEPKVHIFDTKSDQGKRRLEEMKQWGRKQGKKSAYENILDKNKVLFDCWTRYGGSGSPGIEMGLDGEPVCSLMLLRGFPDFVYSEGYHSKKEYHPYMVEQGVTMEAIAAALNRMGSEEKALKREIFGDNAFLY